MQCHDGRYRGLDGAENLYTANCGHSGPRHGIQGVLQSLVLFQPGLLACCRGVSAARQRAESVLRLYKCIKGEVLGVVAIDGTRTNYCALCISYSSRRRKIGHSDSESGQLRMSPGRGLRMLTDARAPTRQLIFNQTSTRLGQVAVGRTSILLLSNTKSIALLNKRRLSIQNSRWMLYRHPLAAERFEWTACISDFREFHFFLRTSGRRILFRYYRCGGLKKLSWNGKAE